MRLARDWSLDLDDVKQEIALIIIETLPRIRTPFRGVCKNPQFECAPESAHHTVRCPPVLFL